MNRGERGFTILLTAITALFVVLLATGVADELAQHAWFNSGANVIQWSTGVAAFGAIASYVWARWTKRCAVPWCVRQGEHPVGGTLAKVCTQHHHLDYHRVVHNLEGELHELSGRLGWGETHDTFAGVEHVEEPRLPDPPGAPITTRVLRQRRDADDQPDAAEEEHE